MNKTNSPIDVLITLPFSPSLIQKLQEVSPNLRITVHPAQKVSDIPEDLWARTQVLYTNRIIPDPELAPAIEWIQFHWAGIDQLIDAPLLSRPGIKVTTLSGASASQMAEYALTMLLALGRNLPALGELQKKAIWPENRWEKFSPRELRTSTVGIVGYGSIGRQIARLLQPFGTTVLASKKNAMQPGDSGYTPEGIGDPEGNFVHRLYPAQALKTMLKTCDFVVVTVPLTPNTRNLINENVFAAMKPNAYLIDISRGGVINHEALIKALNDKKLAGAALDVFPEEPLPEDNPLWKLPNVIITPHIAGMSKQYDQRAAALFAENLSRYIADLPLFNLFEHTKGY
ncbi:MAG: D-2-hydroxyacid dehydrogenase [Anaerolineales bacterium]